MAQETLQFDGRRVVVTGAASGIGQATARLLLERGAEVVAADLAEAGLAPLVELGATAVRCDLARAEDRARLAEAGDGAHGLVNAAGAMRVVALSEATEADWDIVLGVNAKAVFFLCQAFGRRLADGGSIVNLSSVAPWAATPEVAAYAASKAAVISITRSYARELAPRGIRVNAVLPGIIDTPMQDTVLERVAPLRGMTAAELREARKSGVALGREAAPAECAEVILFLLGPGASYVTGECVHVNGGLLMV